MNRVKPDHDKHAAVQDPVCASLSIHEPQIARRVRAYQKPFIDNEALLIQPSQDVLCRVRLPCLVKQFDFICVWTGEMVNTCSET